MSYALEESKKEFRESIGKYSDYSLVSIMMANDIERYESKLITIKDKEFAKFIYGECEKELKIRLDIKGR